MSDILVEIDKFIASNKDVLSVLPINTKKNQLLFVNFTFLYRKKTLISQSLSKLN